MKPLKLLAGLGVALVAMVAAAISGGGGGNKLASGQVPPKQTKFTRDDALKLLRDAMLAATGMSPSSAELAMVAAQSAFETGQWRAIWHNNFGNSVLGSAKAQWYALTGTPGYKYRVFPTAADGALYYVNLLMKRYPDAWALRGTGDTAAYVHALKLGHYFTGDEHNYAGGVKRFYRELMAAQGEAVS